MLTLFQIITLDNWNLLVRPVVASGPGPRPKRTTGNNSEISGLVIIKPPLGRGFDNHDIWFEGPWGTRPPVARGPGPWGTRPPVG